VTRHVYRVFARDVADGTARLSPEDERHLRQVLRMQVGDTCEVVWEGRVHRGRLLPQGCELL
jgi:16S rRNA U1498 N3-methylase RsmE